MQGGLPGAVVQAGQVEFPKADARLTVHDHQRGAVSVGDQVWYR
jgi:hypothetical protein